MTDKRLTIVSSELKRVRTELRELGFDGKPRVVKALIRELHKLKALQAKGHEIIPNF